MKPTIRLHTVHLEPRRGKNYAEVMFMGDLHLGHPQSWVARFKEFLEYCIAHQIYVFFMGDMIESGLTSSIGDSVYQQKLNPQEQMEAVMELIKPVVKKGLVVGYLAGNHEFRIKKETSIDVAKNICREMKIPYLGYACWNLFYVGTQHYSVYTYHGSSGSRFIHTKLKAAIDLSHYMMSDLLVMAHVHDVDSTPIERQYVDLHTHSVKVKKQYVVLSGHYLGYDKSYAQEKGYPPSKLGSPRVLFNAKEKDIHVSN